MILIPIPGALSLLICLRISSDRPATPSLSTTKFPPQLKRSEDPRLFFQLISLYSSVGVSTLPRRVFHACNVLVINKRRVGIFRRMGEQFMERGTTVEYVRITSRPYIIIKRHGNAPNSGATSITLLLPSRLTSKSGRLVRSTPAIVFTRPSLDPWKIIRYRRDDRRISIFSINSSSSPLQNYRFEKTIKS